MLTQDGISELANYSEFVMANNIVQLFVSDPVLSISQTQSSESL